MLQVTPEILIKVALLVFELLSPEQNCYYHRMSIYENRPLNILYDMDHHEGDQGAANPS